MPAPPSDEDYTAFVHATWPSLYRTAYMLLGDHGLAEDLVQTALAKTYGSWRNVRNLDAAGGYARTTLINTASSWFRRPSWRRELAHEEIGGASHEPDPSDRPAVLDALRQLAPRQRAVIVLRFYEDMSVAQAAAALGCSAGTVKSQTSDALARLRSVLGDAAIPMGALHD
jgi:RNA polymerase sigma-70 factor (sigma-E family)